MTDETTNNQDGEAPNAGMAFPLGEPSQASGQAQDTNEAGSKDQQETTSDEGWGKFKTKDEAMKAYEELEKSHTQARQQLAEVTKQPAVAQESEQPKEFLKFNFGQEEDTNLYPSTNQLLDKTVNKRLGEFGQEIAKQVNPVISGLVQEVNTLKQQLLSADSRTVAASAAEDFPELRTDKEFAKEVEDTMKDMQTKLRVNLADAQQFDALLRNACYAVRGRKGYQLSQEQKGEMQRAGAQAMKIMSPGQSSKKGETRSEADIIREGIMNARKPDSIF
jgi:hypothetical protein